MEADERQAHRGLKVENRLRWEKRVQWANRMRCEDEEEDAMDEKMTPVTTE